ncbi:hypothetical protein C163_16595 [Pseudomonas sp. FGI182]|uniref:DUF2511 domain-containing protein n=1 Tax=Pseudomonas sp. FGI182 TaxID=1259844 RepID=UPI0003D87382|nr:DUF2511 domain-containing protein [Pseudomonas sp. FGI182]AHD17271.1 hypothetical protein C163_16595 [Pseudomonas sp. FGI182]
MLKEMVGTGLLLAAFALVGCSGQDEGKEVSAKDFGDDWPFTVSSVQLFCEPNPPKAFMKAPDGSFYALNASAKRFAQQRGWLEVKRVLKPSRWIEGVPADYLTISQQAIELCPQS